MRWLLVSSQHHPTHGGIGGYVHRFVKAATRHGWHVELITRPSDLLPPASRVHEVTTADMCAEFESRIPALRRLERIRPYRYCLWSLAVANRLLELPNEFDAIEFVDCQAEGYVSLASRAVRERFRGSPMIVHAHTPMFLEEHINGVEVKRFGRAIYHEWERRALALADGVIVTSALLGDRLRLTQAAAIIPYIIEPESMAKVPPRSNEILFVGTIQPRKGVEEWVESLNAVFASELGSTAALIGADTPSDLHHKGMISHALHKLRSEHANRVTWLGPLPHEQVMQHISRAAMMVVPSRFESFSFAAAEALCCCTPVIISDQVGIAEHVPELMTFPSGDVDALAEAQLTVLNDRAAAQRRAQICKEKLIEVCAPSRTLELRQAFLDEIRSVSNASAFDDSPDDCLIEMEEFIRGVELAEAELSRAAVSSAVS